MREVRNVSMKRKPGCSEEETWQMHETVRDAQKMLQDAQEELQHSAENMWTFRRKCKTSRTTSRISRTRRATDAGSVQRCSMNISGCGRAAAGLPTVFEDLCRRRTQFPQGTLMQKYATCKNGVRTSVQRWIKKRRVPSPVTRLARESCGS